MHAYKINIYVYLYYLSNVYLYIQVIFSHAYVYIQVIVSSVYIYIQVIFSNVYVYIQVIFSNVYLYIQVIFSNVHVYIQVIFRTTEDSRKTLAKDRRLLFLSHTLSLHLQPLKYHNHNHAF